MSRLFLDCLGREIKVGDVIANGYRDADRGAIAIGVVREITESAMKVDKLQRGDWHGYHDDNVEHRWWMQSEKGNAWRVIKGQCSYGERCFITGMSEADLRKVVGLDVLQPGKDEEKQ